MYELEPDEEVDHRYLEEGALNTAKLCQTQGVRLAHTSVAQLGTMVKVTSPSLGNTEVYDMVLAERKEFEASILWRAQRNRGSG